MTKIIQFHRPGFLKRWWCSTLLQNVSRTNPVNSSIQRQLRITKNNDRSTLHVLLYLLKKLNCKQEPTIIILNGNCVTQLETLFHTTYFNWFDEKCNYYKYLPEDQFQSVLKGQLKMDLSTLTFLIYTIDTNDKYHCHQDLLTIFNFLTKLPEEVSLKDYTTSYRKKSIPALQVLLNIVLENLLNLFAELNPNWQLITNICIQFMSRGYNLNGYKHDEFYRLPLIFIAVQIAIQNDFKCLLEIFLEMGPIDWNFRFHELRYVQINRNYSTFESLFNMGLLLQENNQDLNEIGHIRVDYNNSMDLCYKVEYAKLAEFVMGVSGHSGNLSGLCHYSTAERDKDFKMCERFQRHIEILELFLEKGIPIPNGWEKFVELHDCLFYQEEGFQFLKKLQWAGANVIGGLRKILNFRFIDKNSTFYKGVLKFTEWFEGQDSLELRLVHLAKKKVQHSLNIEVMEREIKSGLRPQQFKTLMFNYKPRIEEKKQHVFDM